jgi:HlyD family secretion protein
VDLVTVATRPLVVSVDEEGKTRVRDTYTVSAPVMGRVHRTKLEAGDPVVAGQTVVAEIEPSDPALLDERSRAEAEADLAAAEADHSLAEAELEEALAELEFAEAELARARRLAKTDTISEREVDQAELGFKTRRAAVGTARAGLRVREQAIARARARLTSPAWTMARTEACDCVVETAPVSGRVLRILQESEAVVESGTPLLEIGDPEDLEVVVDMLSTEAVRVRPGQRTVIEGWGGVDPLGGEVVRIEPYGFTKMSALGVEGQRVNVIVALTSERTAWQALGHGFRVDVHVVVWESEAALTVPVTALFRHQAGWAVFVEEAGSARLRRVEIGHRAGLVTEVTAGLAAGDRVIASPSERIADGVAVVGREAR